MPRVCSQCAGLVSEKPHNTPPKGPGDGGKAERSVYLCTESNTKKGGAPHPEAGGRGLHAELDEPGLRATRVSGLSQKP